MNDLISRQAAIDAIQKLNIPEDMCVFEIMSHIEVEIATLPSAQPERPKGQWIVVDRPIEGSAICECSQCKHRVWKYEGENVVDMWWFCPKCGAKMENGA